MGHFGSTNHLVKRFFYSLRKFDKSDEGQLTLFALLNEKEKQLFIHQSKADQKHSLRSVMRLVEIEGPDAHPDLVVAAALHDVGKTQSQLGVLGRVVATCVSAI